MYSISIEELYKEIINYLEREFDEFKGLSSLKVVQLYHKTNDLSIPYFGVIKEYIKEEEEIV